MSNLSSKQFFTDNDNKELQALSHHEIDNFPNEDGRRRAINNSPNVYIVNALTLIVKAINSNTAQLAKIEQLLKDQHK